MTTFEDREKGFEAKFKREEEIRFKVVARRNKLLGLWAAQQMGLTEAEAEAYAKDVVVADFEEPGDDDVVRKVIGDLTGKGVETDEKTIRREMERLFDVARDQLHAEGGSE